MAELLVARRSRRRYLENISWRLKDPQNPFDSSETEFMQRFRLSRSAAVEVISELRPFVLLGNSGYSLEICVILKMSTKTVKNIREPLKKPMSLKYAAVHQLKEIKETLNVKARTDQDWRGDCKTVNETLSKARQRTLFVDVRFLVGREGSNARYFSAHKMILACGSPVFEAMFFGLLAEKKDPISMPDDDPQGFEFMLRYLYGERICFPSIVVACKAYSVADKYLIPQLQKMSANFIALVNMDDASFWGIIEGNLLDCKNAEEKFKKYIQVHAARLLKSDEFLEVPEDIVKMILQMDQMDITEYELLCFATKWGSKRFTKDTACKLQTLLHNIRFSTLTAQEFCRFHESFPDGLYTRTCLKILKHLIDPDTYNPPYWCSKNKTKRNVN